MSYSKILFFMAIASILFVFTSFAEDLKSGQQYASRTMEAGTKIELSIGDKSLPAILNDSITSKALIAKLPYTVKLQRYSHGYCGVIGEKLPYEQGQLHSGWLNGDIVFSKDSNELAILYKDENISAGLYDGLVTLGIITAPLATLEELDKNLTITITVE